MTEATLSSPRSLHLGSDKRLVVALGLALAALFVLDVWGTYTFLTARVPGANDFYGRWAGARAYFFQGLNPYSEEVSRQIQMGIYGRLDQADEDQGRLFSYPFYAVFLVGPLTLLPYAWASAVWLVLLEFGLLAALVLILDLYRWRPPPALLALTAVWTVLFYPDARGILLGQLVIIIFLLLVVTLWALAHQRNGLAGMALALATIKPQVVLLVIPLLLLWAVHHRRWRFMGTFALTLGTLLAASFLMLPSWLGDFIRQAGTYSSYTPASPPWVLTHLIFPALGTPGEVAITLALLVVLAWAWWREVRSGWLSFHWTLGLTLIISNLVMVRTGTAATTNHVVFLLPLVPLFRHLYRRAGAPALLAMQIVLFVSLWVLFLATVEGRHESVVMFLPLPLFMLVVLFWGRRALAQPLGDGR